MQGIVFNGHYLMYFDVAFTEYWRELGLESPLEQAKTGYEMFARKSTIEFHAPARFDDLLDVFVRCVKLGRTSLQFLLEIHRQGDPDQTQDELLVSGELVYVYANALARAPEPVPGHWRERLRTFEAKSEL